jgi:hypothetical protein
MQDNVLWTKGKHNITFGFQFQALEDNENTPLTGTQAGFTFSNNETANFSSTGTLISTTGLAYAGFCWGRGQQRGDPELVAETGGRYKTYAVLRAGRFQSQFAPDLNLGLRWKHLEPVHGSEQRHVVL